MVKFYSASETYPYPFPAVTLAYFLRYPNPYASHVLSTDTIARTFDPETQRLTTIRLHLKRSKLPSAVLKLLPKSLLGASATGESQTFILEKSVVDIKEGWMDTESRNLEWTGVLSVVERQKFLRPDPSTSTSPAAILDPNTPRRHGFLNLGKDAKVEDSSEITDVTSSVTLHSHVGETWRKKREAAREGAANGEDEHGLLTVLGNAGFAAQYREDWSHACAALTAECTRRHESGSRAHARRRTGQGSGRHEGRSGGDIGWETAGCAEQDWRE
jgi:4-amino-4-deoxychorismate lyase